MRKAILLFVILFSIFSQSFAQITITSNTNEQKLQFISMTSIMSEEDIKKNTDENGSINIEVIKEAVLKSGKGYIKPDRISKIITIVPFYPAENKMYLLIGEQTKYIATTLNVYLEKQYQYGDIAGLSANQKNEEIILVAIK
ncbi:MAG TPA: hypothetical protein PK720_00155 [bacterium]|nr:hypothetical protein [bacterium]